MKNFNSLFSISSILAFVLLISCNIEPYEDDAIDDENVQPTVKTCEETSQDVTDAALDFVNVTSTNYTDLCGAYKVALQNQISACGDADGTLQAVIDGLGDCNSIVNLEIGSIGPGGGYVFYLDGAGGGMEVAPLETEFQSQWGCYSTDVSGTRNDVGEGKYNTDVILSYHDDIDFYNSPEQCQEFVSLVGIIQSTGDVAAKKCADLNYGGYNDWYLPSIGELDLIYKNLFANELGDFSSEPILMSSTQSSADYKMAQVFQFSNSGKIWGIWKHNLSEYRAIRSF